MVYVLEKIKITVVARVVNNETEINCSTNCMLQHTPTLEDRVVDQSKFSNKILEWFLMSVTVKGYDVIFECTKDVRQDVFSLVKPKTEHIGLTPSM